MTENDIKLIHKANQLSYLDWDIAAHYARLADTLEARVELNRICSRLWHTCEAKSGLD